MRTTDRVRGLGLYASMCCIEEVLFDVTDDFSRCPKCEKLCQWELVEEVFSWHQLEEMEQAA